VRQYDNFEYPYDLIRQPPESNLGIVVVIPAFNEPDIGFCIESIWQADSLKDIGVEVIVVVNDAENSPPAIVDQNDLTYLQLKGFSATLESNASMRLHPIRIKGLPAKQAGVGLARKIGMDEAVKRLLQVDAGEGVICSLDADVRIDPNYFEEVWKAYQQDEALRAANIYFEHSSNEHSKSIVQYELHLRYHIHMQRLLDLPFAYHTIGSAMTVRASAYLAHFGMNKRQAGEDFYFLHKFIKTGYFREINTTTVYPSARFSDRVPFGTGQSLRKLTRDAVHFTTYHPKSYLSLRQLLKQLDQLYEAENPNEVALDKFVLAFFGDELAEKLAELKKHTKDFRSFKKRFFQWFDAFMLIKYLHFMRDHHRENIPVEQAVGHLFELMEWPDDGDSVSRLMHMREWDRNQK
jgi:glycosyltransferase involved in cell wall biosynthesis